MDDQDVASDVSPVDREGAIGLWRSVLAAAALLAITFAAYFPVLNAGFIWDDHENLVNNQTITSPAGLRQIWLAPHGTEQYQPLTYSSYWLEYRLWELSPRGYHLTNLLLHSAAVLFAWQLLRRLQVPGAWFAAALFALHPVEVESVAWITERKNLLSLSLALLSMLCYLRFAPPRSEERADSLPGQARWLWYALALVFFALALAAKSVVATMPGVLLVIYWWKQGRISRADFARLLPLFALSVAMSVVTLQREADHLGTPGKVWPLPAGERFQLFGQSLWFYAGKLLWPHPLAFFYPHWKLDAQAWQQNLWTIAALALLLALWLARGRLGRGPFAAVLIFAGVLAPTFGFFNSYYMTYAYVSDHFQYHASLALLALAAAAATLAVSRLGRGARGAAYFVAGLLLVGLGSITYRQTMIYHDLESLYRDTIAKNPDCTIAYSNLAVYLSMRGNYEEAIVLTRHVLSVDENDAIAQINMGTYLLQLGNRQGFKEGQLEETIEHLRKGIELAHDAWGTAPNEARLRTYLGNCLMQTGYSRGFQPELLDEVFANLNEATRLDPNYLDAHVNLALALAAADRSVEAIAHAARALELDPTAASGLRDQLGPDLLAEAHCARGEALASKGDFAAAAEHFTTAIELRDDHDRARNNLGVVLMNLGKTDEAILWFEEAVRGTPSYAEAKANLEKARQVQSEQRGKK